MLRIFKGLNIAYYMVASFLGVILALALLAMGVGEITALIIIMAWVIITTLIFNYLANRKASDLAAIRERCQTKEYISQCAKLLTNQKQGSMGDSIVRLNMAAGYLDMGEIQKAFDVMGRINPGANRRTVLGRGLAAVYHNNYSLAFLKANKIDMAISALRSCYNVINDPKFPAKEKARIENACRLRQAQIDVVTGTENRIPAAEREFEKYIANAHSIIEKVAGRYWQARICYMKGLRDQEKSLLEYVAANGGDTSYAAEARRILDEYEFPTENDIPEYIDDPEYIDEMIEMGDESDESL